MRRLLIAAVCLALAAPALAQTPPPETITFEGLGTPIPYEVGADVPASARLDSVPLAGGGTLRLRSRRGQDYVALVTHFGTTGIAAVSKKGRINNPERSVRDVDVRIRNAPGARLDSFVAIQAGRRVDTKGNSDPADDETFFDAPGGASFLLHDARKRLYPQSGRRLTITRAGADPLNLVKDPYDLTTTSLDFTRLLIWGDVVYDDVVVSHGH